jgi:glutamate synthase (NADPH) small chain
LKFLGHEGQITGVEVEQVSWDRVNGQLSMVAVPGTRRIIETDFVLLAMGFVHPVIDGLVTELNLERDKRGNVKVDEKLRTSQNKVFAAGDTVNGASLVVRAIASGRQAAKEINKFLINK